MKVMEKDYWGLLADKDGESISMILDKHDLLGLLGQILLRDDALP